MVKKLICAFLLTLTFHGVQAQNQLQQGKQIDLLLATLTKYHYSPKTVGQKELQEINYIFLNELDHDQVYFTKQDITKLISDAQAVSGVGNSGAHFFNAAFELFVNRIVFQKNLVENFISKKINFDSKTVFKSHQSGDFSMANTQQDLLKRYEQVLKYNCLDQMYDWADLSDSTIITKDSLLQYEEDAKEVITEEAVLFAKMAVETSADLKDMLYDEYLNCISTYFDPYSMFFSVSKKQKFEQALSKEILVFGFVLRPNDKKEMVIEKLRPGTAAWKSGELNEGDVILEIRVKGGKRIIPSQMSYNKFARALDEISNEDVVIKVRKENNVIKRVTISKQKETVSDNIIKAYILKDKEGVKIGYVSLPSFYTNMNGGVNDGLGCANDIAKEIIKLQNDTPLDGLILDLRYNGGGSLTEAVDLAGIFIDAGPMLVYHGKGEKPQTMKDRNRGAAYTGPMAVLINGSSASASEVVAASLQDYNRAVIIGQSSYGKASAQSVIPVDTTMLTGQSLLGGESMGYLKITQGVLYRVTTHSNQRVGVVPDVKIPGLLEFAVDREIDNKYALKTGKVNKKVYYRPLMGLPSTSLSDKSKTRVAGSTSYIEIKKLNTKYEVMYNELENGISLNINDFITRKQQMDEIIAELVEVRFKKTTTFKAQSSTFEQDILDAANKDGDNVDKMIEVLEEDIFLEESFNVVKDLIKSSK